MTHKQEAYKIAQFILDEIVDKNKGQLTLRGTIHILREAASTLESDALSVHTKTYLLNDES